jgi:hypothetical protein
VPPRVARAHRQRQASTLFLRVPTQDWRRVIRGEITEFRAAPGNVPQMLQVVLPTAVVAYRIHAGKHDTKLMLLEAVRQEALGTISVEGLRAAGFRDSDPAIARSRFRRDWISRTRRRFPPLKRVFVFTVRPFSPEDVATCAWRLFDHLYGEHVNGLAS